MSLSVEFRSGLMSRARRARRLSRASLPQQPREQAEHGAEEQAGDDGKRSKLPSAFHGTGGKVKRPLALLHRDVARQMPQPAQPAGLPRHRPENEVSCPLSFKALAAITSTKPTMTSSFPRSFMRELQARPLRPVRMH